jgi:hypothetical protein
MKKHELLMWALSEMMVNLNTMGNEKESSEAVVNTFRFTHRTLQQNFMRVIVIPILKHLADQHLAGAVDDRNRKSAALATKMLRAVTDEDLFLPLV